VAKKVLGEEAKEQQELEAKKNDPRRQEAIASLFHVRDRDKVGGKEAKEQQKLEAKENDPRGQEAIASLFHVRDKEKVCSNTCKESEKQKKLSWASNIQFFSLY